MKDMAERVRDIAEIRANKEWSRVFAFTGSVQEANVAGREKYAETVRDLAAIVQVRAREISRVAW